jgi:hypothetical protein
METDQEGNGDGVVELVVTRYVQLVGPVHRTQHWILYLSHRDYQRREIVEINTVRL